MRVLVVEDDAEIAELVAARLRRERMAVDVALDGAAGLGRALVYDYDAIVLDRDLPAVHGDDVCRQLVAAGCRARLLMLTAAGTSADLVHGLGLGADDYLAKPFDFAVLVARITALARRAQPAIPPVLRCADVVVDSAGPGRVRRGAAERVWDEFADPFTRTVTITLSRLRAKLGDPPLIETVPRSGYRMAARP